MFDLRKYQQECIDILNSKQNGSYMVCLPTGSGKTIIFSHLHRRGKVLAIAHRSELIDQMANAFKNIGATVEIEQASQRATGDADVIVASIQSLEKRLDKFPRDFASQIIFDEAHRGTAATYKKVRDYFNPQVQFHFTATPNRLDGLGYSSFIDEIAYQKDIRYMVENGYLCNIECKRVQFGFNLDNISVRAGDFDANELGTRLSGTEAGVAETYYKYARGNTVIFAANLRHAKEISRYIKEAYVISGSMPKQERKNILEAYSKGDIKCIVNCNVLIEGWDAPITETVIHARPTKSQTFYIQASGRGMRLYPGKESVLLIDCVGITNHSLCSAPTLLGYDLDNVPEKMKGKIEGNLFELSKEIEKALDTPEGLIQSVKDIDIWSKKEKLNLHGIAFRRRANGSLVVTLPNNIYYEVPPVDLLGNVTFDNGQKATAQEAIDMVFKHLRTYHKDCIHLWRSALSEKWQKKPATLAQQAYLRKLKNIDLSGIDITQITSGEAATIISEARIREGKI